MTARPLDIHGYYNTGQRAVGLPMIGHLARVAGGARLVRTRRGFALFDEKGRFVGIVRAPDPGTAFGPAGCTVLLRR